MASHAAWLAAMYFALDEMSATDLFLLMYQETDVDPMLKIPPDVLFLSNGFSYQSASVKPWIFTPYVCMYHNPYSVVPLKHLKACFPAFQKSLVGLTITWINWLSA